MHVHCLFQHTKLRDVWLKLKKLLNTTLNIKKKKKNLFMLANLFSHLFCILRHCSSFRKSFYTRLADGCNGCKMILSGVDGHICQPTPYITHTNTHPVNPRPPWDSPESHCYALLPPPPPPAAHSPPTVLLLLTASQHIKIPTKTWEIRLKQPSLSLFIQPPLWLNCSRFITDVVQTHAWPPTEDCELQRVW